MPLAINWPSTLLISVCTILHVSWYGTLRQWMLHDAVLQWMQHGTVLHWMLHCTTVRKVQRWPEYQSYQWGLLHDWQQPVVLEDPVALAPGGWNGCVPPVPRVPGGWSDCIPSVPRVPMELICWFVLSPASPKATWRLERLSPRDYLAEGPNKTKIRLCVCLLFSVF